MYIAIDHLSCLFDTANTVGQSPGGIPPYEIAEQPAHNSAHTVPSAKSPDISLIVVASVLALNGRVEVKNMIPQTLRLEAPDGSVARQYRVSNNAVEVRYSEVPRYEPGGTWQRLTPQQLSDHVKRSDIVSKWLQYRIGWRRLLQMCVGEEHAWTSYERSEMQAA